MNVKTIQLDVMDGEFVPNTSLQFDFTVPRKSHSGQPLSLTYEAHLMIEHPEQWIEEHGDKVDIILPHFESCTDPDSIIALAREKGKKIGFAIGPKTPIETIIPYLGQIDMVNVMTGEPGKYGTPFDPETLIKVEELRKLRNDIDIEVDVGITPSTIGKASRAGANKFISGSYLQNSSNTKQAIAELQKNW